MCHLGNSFQTQSSFTTASVQLPYSFPTASILIGHYILNISSSTQESTCAIDDSGELHSNSESFEPNGSSKRASTYSSNTARGSGSNTGNRNSNFVVLHPTVSPDGDVSYFATPSNAQSSSAGVGKSASDRVVPLVTTVTTGSAGTPHLVTHNSTKTSVHKTNPRGSGRKLAKNNRISDLNAVPVDRTDSFGGMFNPGGNNNIHGNNNRASGCKQSSTVGRQGPSIGNNNNSSARVSGNLHAAMGQNNPHWMNNMTSNHQTNNIDQLLRT